MTDDELALTLLTAQLRAANRRIHEQDATISLLSEHNARLRDAVGHLDAENRTLKRQLGLLPRPMPPQALRHG